MEPEAVEGHRIRMLVTGIAVLLLTFAETEALLSPLDFLALQTLKKSLGDMPGSTYFSSWDFTQDPCGFPGILCSSEEPQRVIVLNLGDLSAGSAGLRGKLTGAIGLLVALVELTIVPGQVTGPIPMALFQLRELQFLGLSKNYLTGDIPHQLALLKNLQTLDLSYNQLHGSIPEGLAHLPLSNLILSHNKLSGSIPNLNAATNLIRLDLRHNSLSGSLPSLSPSLEYLSASHNSLSGELQELAGLQQLNYLDLSFNKLSGNVPGSLLELPQLTSLQLQRNSLSGAISLTKPANVQMVDLSYNNLRGQISPLLANVQNLYLNNNHFAGPLPDEVVTRLLSGSIKILYLQHNYLTNVPLGANAKLPVTTSLCAQYNCMFPPVQSHCPANVGKQKRRPVYQCRGSRHR